MKPLSLTNLPACRRYQCNILCGLVLALCCRDLYSQVQDNPFVTASRNPFVQIYGLPAAQSAQLITSNSMLFSVQLEAVSNFTINQEGNEAVHIDGETYRANVQFRYGLTDAIELGIDMPYISHQGGGLDGFIDQWHDFFGLPDGGRSNVPEDLINYRYRYGTNTLVDIDQASEGVGDVSLSVGYQLSDSKLRQWAVRGGVKLPSGDADSLTGSQSTDLFVGIHLSDQGLLQAYNMDLHASGGVLLLGDSEVINSKRRDWVAYGSTTLSWRFSERLSFKAQLDAHSAFYDSVLKELGNNSAQLIMGAALTLSDHWALDISVSEDIAVDTAPDVAFQLALTHRAQ